jgi:flavorubredoxin
VWVSHVELPHGGNAQALAERYPKARLVIGGGGDNYSIYGLGDALRVLPRDRLSLGNFELEFVEPVIVDHALTSWVYEHKSGFLCTVDFGCNLHSPSECYRFLDELDVTKPFVFDDVVGQLRGAFSWLAWADAEEIVEALDSMLKNLDVRLFAPMHGSVVRRDIPQHIELLKRGIRKAASLPPWWEEIATKAGSGSSA